MTRRDVDEWKQDLKAIKRIHQRVHEVCAILGLSIDSQAPVQIRGAWISIGTKGCPRCADEAELYSIQKLPIQYLWAPNEELEQVAAKSRERKAKALQVELFFGTMRRQRDAKKQASAPLDPQLENLWEPTDETVETQTL